MALTSPRFTNVEQLTLAAANSPWLSRGARGHGVHLIQFALIDLGFPMPRSVGGRQMSPDGIFGSETKDKVEEFQRSTLGGPPVTDDGVVGANTMAKLDRAIGGLTHRVSVELWTTRPSAVSIFSMIRVAEQVYARYGIKFEVRFGRSIAPSAADQAKLKDQSTPFRDLLALVTKLTGRGFGPTDTLAIQIDRLNPDDARGLTLSNTSAALVRLCEHANESTFGHEVGHVLLTPATPARRRRPQLHSSREPHGHWDAGVPLCADN